MNQFERIQNGKNAEATDARSVLLDTLYAVAWSDAARALWAVYRRSTAATFARFESLLLPISLCGAVGMPIYYFIWSELFPQAYENLNECHFA